MRKSKFTESQRMAILARVDASIRKKKMKWLITLCSCFLFLGCFHETSEEVSILEQVIQSNYNNKPISRQLIPSRDYESWEKGRSKKAIRNGLEISIPPTPPIDTAIFFVDFFDKLVLKNIISAQEKDELIEDLFKAEDGLFLKHNKETGILDLEEILEEQKSTNKLSNGHNFYQFSIPILSSKKDLIIFMVNNMQGSSSYGEFVVFRKINGVWTMMSREQKWIT
jgi:hypothetical protein